MQDVSIKPIFSLITASILALSGCSNSSSSDQPEPPVTQSQNLNGEAVKGILASAPVTAFNLDRSTTYGTTQTAADGTYSLSGLSLGSGPVLVELTTDSDTLMTCDSAMGCTFDGTTYDFGADFVFDDPDFVLTAILPGVASDATDARLMVTPVTHMAAQRAIASGATTAEAIEGVNRATARLLGLDNVDITSLAPSDITSTDSGSDDSAAQKYGALVAAFATLAEASGGDIEAALRQIVDDYAQDGGMKANTTVEGELALANIFGAAQQSAEKAQQSGINLGNTGAALALETLEAESAPADSVITPDDEEEVPSALMTEEEATEAGIALLNDLNNWYQALSNADVDTKGDMYAAQIEAAADLLPAFDGLSTEIENFTSLVVTTRPECAEIYSYYSYYYQQYFAYCTAYRDVTGPGPLLDAAELVGWLGQYAQYIEKNHRSLPYTINADRSYSLNTAALGSRLNHLGIKKFLTYDDGYNYPGSVITANYQWSNGNISEVTFYGMSNNFKISSSTQPAYLSVELTGSSLTYEMTNLKLTPRSYYRAGFTEVSVPSAAVTLNFDSPDSLMNYIDAVYDDYGEIDPGSLESMTAVSSGHAKGYTGTAAFSLNTELTSPSENSRLLTNSLTISSDDSRGEAPDMSGDINISVSGDYEQQGSRFLGFSASLENASLTSDFQGYAHASVSDGSVARFEGKISASVSDSNAQQVIAPTSEVAFEGVMTVSNAAAYPTETTGFSGAARIKMKARQATDGSLIIIDNEPVIHPYEASIAGELNTVSAGESASVSINGLMHVNRMEDIDDPETYGDVALALRIGSTISGLDNAKILVSAIRRAQEDVNGIIQLSYNSPDSSIERIININLDSSADVTDGEFNYLTVANADTEMTIQATCVSGDGTSDCDEFEFTGVITVAGHQVGLLESREGIPVFKFGNEERYRILTPNFLVERVSN